MLRVFFCLLLVIPAYSNALECNRLSVSSNSEYPPYLWKTDTQPAQLEGLLVSFMQRVSEASGLEIEVVYTGPWLRTQSQAQNGYLDLITGFHTEDRSEWLDYLYPELIKTETAVWVNKAKKIEFKELKDLIGYAGLTVLGHSLGQESDAYTKKKLTVTNVSSIQQAFKMLEEQRADYLVYARDPGQAYALQLKTKEVVTLPTPISSELIYLAFSKNSKCNTSAMQEKLSAILKQAKKEKWAEALLVESQRVWLEHKGKP